MAKTNKQRRAEYKGLVAQVEWARAQYMNALDKRREAEDALDSAKYRENKCESQFEYLSDLAAAHPGKDK